MGDLAHDTQNVDHETLKGLVERLFNVESTFADQKAEYNDSKKDLKAEIKSRQEETGISFNQVSGLVKIRLNEAEALDAQAEMESNMELYGAVFGFASPVDEPSSDDDDALG
jgi:uncharacterized protein (UPF0335 family)